MRYVGYAPYAYSLSLSLCTSHSIVSISQCSVRLYVIMCVRACVRVRVRLSFSVSRVCARASSLCPCRIGGGHCHGHCHHVPERLTCAEGMLRRRSQSLWWQGWNAPLLLDSAVRNSLGCLCSALLRLDHYKQLLYPPYSSASSSSLLLFGESGREERFQ